MLLLDFMKDFAARPALGRKVTLEYRDDQRRARIYCNEPAIVARFVAEVGQEIVRRSNDRREVWEPPVFLRGQADNHDGMVPGLFRVCPGTPEATLRQAEAHMEELVSERMRVGRFQRRDLAALLQHYGVRTSWLDVLVDLRVAVWFATHDIGAKTSRRRGGSGWIYLLGNTGTNGLRAIDLRVAHHGLSLRPQTQQGWSVVGQGCDLGEHVVATVEFSIGDQWFLDGYLARPEFLFPPERLDHTLKLLRKPGVAECLRQAEERCRLPAGAFGDISTIG